MKELTVVTDPLVTGTPIVIKDSKLAKFDGGICLLGVGWAQFGADLETGEYINQEIRVEVPQGTEFVDVSLLAVDIAAGSRAGRTPSAIASITTDITIAYKGGKLDIDPAGFCTINFKAALQDKSTIPTSGPWGASFTMQVKCYGKAS